VYASDSVRVSQRVQVLFGQQVRQLRLAAELTQEDLAHRCGLFRTYMSRIETGQANPTLTMVQAIADSLGVSIPTLFQLVQPTRVAVSPKPPRGRRRLG
jgi:transcriptional regulator with XRE-family HTH domain